MPNAQTAWLCALVSGMRYGLGRHVCQHWQEGCFNWGKDLKVKQGSQLQLFTPFGVENLGTRGLSAHSYFKILSKTIADRLGDPAGCYIAQRVRIAVLRVNAAIVLSTFPRSVFLLLWLPEQWKQFRNVPLKICSTGNWTRDLLMQFWDNSFNMIFLFFPNSSYASSADVDLCPR